MPISGCQNILIIGLTVWTQNRSVTNGRTDRITYQHRALHSRMNAGTRWKIITLITPSERQQAV